MILFWSNEDDGYIADMPDLGAFPAHGATSEDALRAIRRTLASLRVAAEERGPKLPPPTLRPTFAEVS
jgi:predicted RNase H-like HicB family nuclease